jgi:hypothetical protein
VPVPLLTHGTATAKNFAYSSGKPCSRKSYITQESIFTPILVNCRDGKSPHEEWQMFRKVIKA